VEKKIRRKILTGEVVSNKMNKTIVVAFHTRKLHMLYKKYITLTKKIKAHDEKNECGVGDVVRVVESRPLSKEKRWRLLEVVRKAE
jgi:small subunit ribosomal protein S17